MSKLLEFLRKNVTKTKKAPIVERSAIFRLCLKFNSGVKVIKIGVSPIGSIITNKVVKIVKNSVTVIVALSKY